VPSIHQPQLQELLLEPALIWGVELTGDRWRGVFDKRCAKAHRSTAKASVASKSGIWSWTRDLELERN